MTKGMTKDQMTMKLLDFHKKRLQRISMEYKYDMFVESYKKYSRQKLEFEYTQTFFNTIKEENGRVYDITKDIIKGSNK